MDFVIDSSHQLREKEAVIVPVLHLGTLARVVLTLPTACVVS